MQKYKKSFAIPVLGIFPLQISCFQRKLDIEND